MTDTERETHIKNLGDQLNGAYDQYKASGCFSARGEADAYRIAMESAIGQRSPAQVLALEIERGLV